VTRSTFSGNRADDYGRGGAIYLPSGGGATVSNSTFSDNHAFNGGAIDNGHDGGNGGPVQVMSSTFSANSSVAGGGAITSLNATLFSNTILANNGDNCSGFVSDGGHNIDDGTTCGFSAAHGSLSNTNPGLSPVGLANNGGPTGTIALQSSSAAINAGNQAACAGPPVNNLDQRGAVRPGAGAINCSIGAYEFNATPPPTPSRTSTRTPTPASTNTPAYTPTSSRTPSPSRTATMRIRTSTATRTASPTHVFRTPTPTSTPVPTLTPKQLCVGDCNSNHSVTIDGLITMVNIALGSAPVSMCSAGDANGSGEITVDEIIGAVRNALEGCPS